MPKPKGIAFKRHPVARGLAAVGEPWPDVDIKFSGKVFGMIGAPSAFGANDWSVSVAVRLADDGSHRRWRWLRFKARHASEDAARAWCKAHLPAWLDKTGDNVYFFED